MALVEAELGVRRAAGAYSGKFAGLAHYFGYEGRCALPTNFDATCGRFMPTFLSCVQHSSIACRPCCQASCCPHASGRGGASAPVNAGHPAACLQTPGERLRRAPQVLLRAGLRGGRAGRAPPDGPHGDHRRAAQAHGRVVRGSA